MYLFMLFVDQGWLQWVTLWDLIRSLKKLEEFPILCNSPFLILLQHSSHPFPVFPTSKLSSLPLPVFPSLILKTIKPTLLKTFDTIKGAFRYFAGNRITGFSYCQCLSRKNSLKYSLLFQSNVDCYKIFV